MKRGGLLRVNAFVVHSICAPTLINSSETQDQLQGLDLPDVIGPLTEDLLVGSDHYWRIVTSQTRQERAVPVSETKIG